MVVMIAAPRIQAQIAPGPARPAARQAPNNQPEPMIEPRPVSMRAKGPTSRRSDCSDMKSLAVRTP